MYYCDACGHIQKDYIATVQEMVTHGACQHPLRHIETQSDAHASINATFERLGKPKNGDAITLIMLGKVGVGKTTLCETIVPPADGGEPPGRGSDSLMTTIDGMRLYLWDTAGQERYGQGAMADMYYRVAHGCILVYDVTDAESFTALEGVLRRARERCAMGTVFALFGNKTDVVEEDEAKRQVPNAEADRFARRQGIALFFEVSALTGDRVVDSITLLCRSICLTRGTMKSLAEVGSSAPGSMKLSPRTDSQKSRTTSPRLKSSLPKC